MKEQNQSRAEGQNPVQRALYILDKLFYNLFASTVRGDPFFSLPSQQVTAPHLTETPDPTSRKKRRSPSAAETPEEFLELAGRGYLAALERNTFASYLRVIDDPQTDIARIEGQAMSTFAATIIDFFHQTKGINPVENDEILTFPDFERTVVWGNRLFRKNSKNSQINSLSSLILSMNQVLAARRKALE